MAYKAKSGKALSDQPSEISFIREMETYKTKIGAES